MVKKIESSAHINRLVQGPRDRHHYTGFGQYMIIIYFGPLAVGSFKPSDLSFTLNKPKRSSARDLAA